MREEEIESLVIGDQDFASLERTLHVFCPFEAVGMVRQEVRHAAFLTYLLNPDRPHGFGADCVRALIAAFSRAIPRGGAPIAPLDAHLMDYQGASAAPWRHVDILIQVPAARVVIAIELKIDADEHGAQLARYREQVRAEWPDWRHVFVFLTKAGDDPSDEFGEDWHAVELESVVSELDRVAERAGGSGASRAMLQAYIAMMRRSHLSDDRLENLARALWLRHREALEFLADRRPSLATDALGLLASRKAEIAAELSRSSGVRIEPEESTGSVLRFAVPSWDSVPDMLEGQGWTSSKRLILIELRAKSAPAKFTAIILLGRGQAAARQRLYDRLIVGGAPPNRSGKLSESWTRLAAKTLYRAKDDSEPDSEKLALRIEKEFLGFMPMQITEFDKALRKG